MTVASDRPILVIRNRRHWYQWQGKLFPSVTTILNAGWPKPALINWAAKVTAEYAVRERHQLWAIAEASETGAIEWLKNARFAKRDSAALRGSEIHALIADGGKATDEQQPYLEAYQRWLEEHRVRIIGQELPLVDTVVGYGGTADLHAEVAGVEMVVDLKTGFVAAEHHAQVAAYARAEIGPRTESAALLALAPTGPQLHLVDVPSAYDAFLAARTIAYYLGGLRDDE